MICSLRTNEKLSLSVMTNIYKLKKLPSVLSQFASEASYVYEIS